VAASDSGGIGKIWWAREMAHQSGSKRELFEVDSEPKRSLAIKCFPLLRPIWRAPPSRTSKGRDAPLMSLRMQPRRRSEGLSFGAGGDADSAPRRAAGDLAIAAAASICGNEPRGSRCSCFTRCWRGGFSRTGSQVSPKRTAAPQSARPVVLAHLFPPSARGIDRLPCR
jgi:hypothetical protein